MSLGQVYDLKDEAQAKEYLEQLGIEYRYQCFEEKLPDGCHRLADFLDTFRKDVTKAASVYLENCENNKYGHSCFKVGHYRYLGTGCEKDVAEAAKYYEMACDNKYYSGCFNAGVLNLKEQLETNVLAKSHIAKGLNLLKSGCEGNNALCCNKLSSIYITGQYGRSRNMDKAFDYAKKACDLGHMYACANLSQMYKRGEGTTKNEELADKYKTYAKTLFKEAKENKVEVEFQKTS